MLYIPHAATDSASGFCLQQYWTKADGNITQTSTSSASLPRSLLISMACRGITACRENSEAPAVPCLYTALVSLALLDSRRPPTGCRDQAVQTLNLGKGWRSWLGGCCTIRVYLRPNLVWISGLRCRSPSFCLVQYSKLAITNGNLPGCWWCQV